VIDQENILGAALNRRGDAMAVTRPEDKRLEDEQVERSLEKLNAVGFGHTGREATSTLGACLLGGDQPRGGDRARPRRPRRVLPHPHSVRSPARSGNEYVAQLLRALQLDAALRATPAARARCVRNSVMVSVSVRQSDSPFFYAMSGDADVAVEWLEKAVEQRDPRVLGILTLATGQVWRASPRWPILAKMMNLSAEVA
jgi:hypothetical protein